MQWTYMLIGLVLGWLLDESLSDAFVGALIGLGIGQVLAIKRLSGQAAEQQRQLHLAQVALGAVEQRLALLEAGGERVAPVAEPQTVASTSPEPAVPELVWELPPELEPQPTPVDHWSAREPEPPDAPHVPNLIERGINAARNWLLGGNTVLRVGVVLLFFGLAFLLRYATEGMVVPLEVRYAGVALAALALMALGWWLRQRNPDYALILQGAGIGVLYLTVFAAMRLHPLLDPTAALGLLVAVTVFSALLAIQQDSLALACAAALGGFAAPILTSTGAGSHVALFSYFLLLNAGILAIAWFKAWRMLNVIGFVGTFGIGFTWGMRAYTPELLASTEPFLIGFFLMYLAIGLLYARRKLHEAQDVPQAEDRAALLQWSARNGDYVDGTLLFGPPLVGFGLQFALVQHLALAPAFSALVLGFLYMGLAYVLRGGRAWLLAQTCLALGVIFTSLAIPLGLDARWTTAAWAVEGAGIYWLGLRQQRPIARAFALLLQLGAALMLLGELREGDSSLLAGSTLGALLVGVALLFSFWQLHQAPLERSRSWERKALPVLACAGLSFLYLLAPLFFFSHGTVIGWALGGLLTLLVGVRLPSRSVLLSALAVQLLAGAVLLVAGSAAEDRTLLAHAGFWAPALLGLVAMLGAWQLQRFASVFSGLDLQRLSYGLLAWGAGWWALALGSEVLHFAAPLLQSAWLLVLLALSVALWSWSALRLNWPALGVLSCALIPAAALVLLGAWHARYHPAADFGWLAWTLLFTVHLLSLKRLASLLPARVASVAHVLGCWLLLAVLVLELRYGLLVLSEQYNAWRWLGWALVPSLYLVAMAAPRAWSWPLSSYSREYRLYAALPLALLMLGWFWLANIASDGAAEPLPYVPLVNPLEIGLLFSLFGVYLWSRNRLDQLPFAQGQLRQIVVGVSLFAFFTAMVMRTAHHWSGVPYELEALLESMRVQAGLSIVWTLIALGLMIGGHLRNRREVWLVGAALIGVVVAKLLFVELSNRGGLARIVSFIGVGVLLLVVGYFAPLPPRRIDATAGPQEAVDESKGVSS